MGTCSHHLQELCFAEHFCGHTSLKRDYFVVLLTQSFGEFNFHIRYTFLMACIVKNLDQIVQNIFENCLFRQNVLTECLQTET